MNGYRLFFALAFCIITISACRDKESVIDESGTCAEQIQFLQKISINPTNADSLLHIWMQMNDEDCIRGYVVTSAQVDYQIAKIYGIKKENDSSLLYLERSFNAIELVPGHLEDKAKIYQGMGNISLRDGLFHKANYYYNKAAAIILADSAIPLETSARISILVAAAQSNQQFERYDLALEMNRRALELSYGLPEGHINRQRPITQLIQTIYHGGSSKDSIGYYVDLLSDMNQRFPESYDPYYIYDAKSLYYSLIGNSDSVLSYHLLMTEIKENEIDNGDTAEINFGNLFISYVNVAAWYTENNQTREATIYFSKAENLMKSHQFVIDYDHLILYHKNLEQYYLKTNNKENALNAAHRVMQLQEEMYARQNTQSIAEMNSLFEIQAQERSIQMLSENVRIKELQLQQSKLWLTVSVLGAIITVLLLLFLYYSFRQRRLQQEKDKSMLQQQLLRTQMEPHFIFNTLTSLQHYIRTGQTNDAIRYLGRFSKLLRNSFELSREEFVSLGDEIETLEHYLSLQQMRFENAFAYMIHFDDDIEVDDILIPPMLIQPFVENAILHGVDMKSKDGMIQIFFSVQENLLKVQVIDTGRITESKSTTAKHRSLSGTISRERLALLGNGAKLENFKGHDGSTTVVLIIPY